MTTTISTAAGRREQKPRMNQSEEQGRSSKTTKERPIEADAWATKDSSDTVGKNVDIPEKNPKNSIAADARPRESATTTSSTVLSEDGEVKQISTDVCLLHKSVISRTTCAVRVRNRAGMRA